MTGPRVSSGWLRLGRAAVLAVLVIALGSAAHVAGGEAVPHPLTLLLLALPVAAFALWFTRERRGPLALALSLGGTQLVLHHALMGLGAVPSAFGSSASHHQAVAMRMAPNATVGPQFLVPGAAMLLLHAAAVIVIALVLAHGDALLAVVVAAVELLLRPLVPLATNTLQPWTPALVVRAQWVPRPRLRVEDVGRRGPP